MNTMKERLRLFFDLVAEGELACNFGEKDLLSFAEAEVHLATIAQSARIAELEGARAKAAEELSAKDAELLLANTKMTGLADSFQRLQDEVNQHRRDLGIVRTPEAGVWFWHGDGKNWPADIAFPVVMSADTLRGFVAQASELERLRAWKEEQQQGLVHLACALIECGLVKGRNGNCMTDAANMIRDYQKQSYELERLRSLVSHIRSLAPNGTRGLGSIMNDVFDAVDAFDKGAILVDPRDAELERLRRSVESAIVWLEGRKYHGEHWAITEALNNLKRVSAPAAQAEPQAARLAQVGDEVWYRPFRNMKEREQGRMVKVTKRGKYEFRVEDGRVIHPWESDDAGTWLRDANFGNTWWWSREDEPQDTGDQGFHADGGK